VQEILGGGDKEVINGIQENKVLTSNVTVLVYNYTRKKISQGSGVIYKNEGDNYYALTNNHVIYEGYYFSVMDAYGDIWDARIEKADENYDLAVLRFRMNTENEFYIPEIVSEDPEVGDNIISITNPLGVVNSVTLGSVKEYLKIDPLDNDTMMDDIGSNVQFEVMKHDAPINSGSSGGAILNYDYKICGINFASGRGKDRKFISGYAVQPTKILEFLTDNNLN
jgi:S1-C subfamily serine protease